MPYPIKYIENNLVWNNEGECFAYYELIPFNYSFLSLEQKDAVHDAFRQLIAQNRDGKIHALQISTESSIRAAQERSKKSVTGRLKEIACAEIDEQTENLIASLGDTQVDYRFFIGFKLVVTDKELSVKEVGNAAKNLLHDAVNAIGHSFMGDFVSMPNDEIRRYSRMEKLMENKLSRRFKVRRLDKNDFGYLLEHIYGRTGTAYEDFEFTLPLKKRKSDTLVKQQKPKKLRVYTVNSRKPAVIVLWLLFVCGFVFAVYKNFTAIDTHTVHEKEIVERRVEDTSGVEVFVRNFAKTYYSWSNNKDSVAQRTDALTGYLTEDLQRLTADTVKSDVAVSSSVQDVQIWSVEQNGSENDFAIVFTVAQTISDGKKKDTVSSVYKTAVHKDDNGDMVITQAPTITGKPAKSAYTPKAAEPDGTVSAAESEDITDFLTTFFTLYPTATEKELSYYVSGDSMPPVKCADYTFSQLKSTVLNKNGDTVTATVAVEYLDSVTQMTQISQFELVLKLVDENWKIVG